MNKSKILKYRPFELKVKLPYINEKYYYIGESNEYFTKGCQYKVVEVSEHWWFKQLGFVIFITNDEYPNTKNIDFCIACDLFEFLDDKRKVFIKY